MEINGKTKVMGLIGDPVEHTMSPVIHNTIAREMGINMVYVPFPVKEPDKAVVGAYALGISGMNVTVPHKSNVIPYLAELNKEAEIIGAVNTLVRGKDGFVGYNTDMPGLYRALLSEGIDLKGSKVIVIGAGGAARAAAFLCAWRGASQIVVLNRTLEKAQRVVSEVKEKTGFEKIEAIAIADWTSISGKDYVVLQATKAGLYPDVEKTPIEDAAFFEKVSVVYDLIYSPSETAFMKMARRKGIKAYHGLKMLLYQGVLAFEYWNEVTVPQDIIDKTYEVLKKECGIYE